MLGILFAVVYGVLHLFSKVSDRHHHLIVGLSCLWFAAFPALTWMQTQLWSNPTVQAVLWAKQKPQSRYALSHAATWFEQMGKYDLAFKYYEQIRTTFPQDTGPYMSWVVLACRYPYIPTPDPSTVRTQFATGLIDTAALSNLNYMLQARLTRACQIDTGILGSYIEALLRNPNPSIYKYYIERMYAIYLAQEGKLDAAVQHLDITLQLKDIPQYRIDKIVWLGRAGRIEAALEYLQQTRHSWNQLTRNAYEVQLNLLETQLKQTLQ
jgi:tetratricopeptide (TPR) repeat protein